MTKLTDKHPTMAKFKKLCALAEYMGLSIRFQGNELELTDCDCDYRLKIRDIEPHGSINTFPPKTEFKIVKVK